MLTRCISGAVLVVIALITILSGGYVLAATLLAISCIAYHELAKVCKIHGEKGFHALEAVSYIAIIFLYVLTVATSDDMFILLWAILTELKRIIQKSFIWTESLWF